MMEGAGLAVIMNLRRRGGGTIRLGGTPDDFGVELIRVIFSRRGAESNKSRSRVAKSSLEVQDSR